jgi:hypothetical protein
MRTLLALSVITCLVAARIEAQPATTAEIASRLAVKRAATATFLDRKQPQETRLAAVRNMGYPEDATLPALLRVATDRKESDVIRLAAFKLHHVSEQYLNAALKVLNEPENGGADLHAGLIEDISRRVTFRLPDETQQRIMRAYRKNLTDKRDKVRLYAFRASVSNHDSVALGMLTESLRRGSGVPIPVADAIDLLDQDGSQNYIGVLRPYLASSDAHVQAKAAMALAVDPESRPQIIRLAESPEAANEVRLNALRALADDDRDFARYAIDLVANAKENPDIRYAAMHGFVGRMNYSNVPVEDQIRFAQVVEKVAGERSLSTTESGARTLKAARELLEYLQKAFPAIQKFYASR